LWFNGQGRDYFFVLTASQGQSAATISAASTLDSGLGFAAPE
jgi:hypothetical protein